MANTFSQIYLQFVFAVSGRRSLIPREHKEELHKYMTKLAQNRKAKMLSIHCMPDHTHMFLGFKPIILISDFVKERLKLKAMNLLITKNGTEEDSTGKKDMVYFHTRIPTLT